MQSSSEPSPLTAGSGPATRRQPAAALVNLSAACWGACAFIPVGVMYLNLLLMIMALGFSADLRQRLAQVRASPHVLPILAMVVWTMFAAAWGPWSDDTGTRLYHVVRVALLLLLGLMLTGAEAWNAFRGFVAGAVVAALVVAVHHVVGLPSWAIWGGLLSSRNNFSSGNMITMATACAILLHLGMTLQHDSPTRWVARLAALGLAMTVALHAVSRNSQLLVVVLVVAVLAYRYRSPARLLATLALVAALVAGMWTLSPTTSSRFSELSQNLQNATQKADYSTSGGVRWRMYQEAVAGMTEQPIVGTGVGSWSPRWRVVWTAIEVGLPPDSKRPFAEINNPHNDFLLAGMETGVIGLVILLWLLASFVQQGWRSRAAAGGLLVVMAVSIFSTALVNAPFRDAALGMTLLWLLGAAAAANRAVTNA